MTAERKTTDRAGWAPEVGVPRTRAARSTSAATRSSWPQSHRSRRARTCVPESTTSSVRKKAR